VSAVTNLRSLERKYSMERFYSHIGRSRQLYHKSISNQQKVALRDQWIINLVLNWRIRHPRMGSRTLYYSIHEAGIELPIGVTLFERLLSERKLTVGTAKRWSPLTSDGLGKKNYPNLTNGLILNDINQLIVADITYFWVPTRWYYLFTLKDVYSQRVISLIPSGNMKADNAIKTLIEFECIRGKDAIKNCIHHTDNGSQYEADKYKAILERLEIKISRANSCEQNGSSEQMNHIVKNMYLQHFGIRTFEELKSACKKVKHLMNNERAVPILGNITVERFEKALFHLPIDQRIQKTMHDFDNDT